MSTNLITTLEDEVAFIYKITIKKKVYIGSTVSPKSRDSSHYSSLVKGTHTNTKLQRAYNKHKEYKFEIIEECKRVDRWKRESHWIIEYNSIDAGYNIAAVDISAEAIKGEHFVRSAAGDEDFIALYERWKTLVEKYWDVEFRASGSVNPMSWLCLVNNVRKNYTRKKKIEHWNSTLDKVENIINKWSELDEGFHYWAQCYFAEPHWSKGSSSSLKQNCVKHPYLLLEVILRQTDDPLFNVIVKKLKQEGLLKTKELIGPPVPTKEQLRETSIREARKKAETGFTLFKRKSR